jgi:hypothetical protein
MSAFTVSNKHISALLNFYASQKPYASPQWLHSLAKPGEFPTQFDDKSILTEIGQVLVNENYRSVNHRYHEQTAAFDFKLQDTDAYKPVDVLSLLDCYDYQSCETDDYYKTPAADVINAIRKAAIKALPGWEDGPWAI